MAFEPGIRRRQMVVGNWKMNGSKQENTHLLAEVMHSWVPLTQVDVAICPPFVYLPQVADTLQGSGIVWGGQSINPNATGAFTGEVSARMLSDFDAAYVIVGHNERRRLRGESDQYVAEQFLAAQREGLIPILCVGESEEAREAGHALDAITAQLSVVIEKAGIGAFANAVVAYEPIWAVGTGKSATPQEAEQVHKHIRQLFGDLGSQLTLLYGGSVKVHNAAELFALEDIDGALLGGASLDAKEFLAICRCAEQASHKG
ncbi:triose-phosphate isomerase [Gilvimarinus sp. SDUM040013]|uniref:Triosephosphate isomerase n=1 Tax=Gilvimarinus gilvus TaxID=3058038 RepID=A0ABU4S0V4_9GAMM|nr:triose-phosphate isomerase [Gilvimarinus sp. SDUM040013]MDO3387205.1 triose-phosphate isomerase [Gilvimarinus sp. SDUM040013]MDX6850768.1 triose-phosphate isomerase [Gilvimarinus sp. SDUM040013]